MTSGEHLIIISSYLLLSNDDILLLYLLAFGLGQGLFLGGLDSTCGDFLQHDLTSLRLLSHSHLLYSQSVIEDSQLFTGLSNLL